VLLHDLIDRLIAWSLIITKATVLHYQVSSCLELCLSMVHQALGRQCWYKLLLIQWSFILLLLEARPSSARKFYYTSFEVVIAEMDSHFARPFACFLTFFWYNRPLRDQLWLQ